MRRKIGACCIVCALLVFLYSCASAPEPIPQPEQPVPAAVEEPRPAVPAPDTQLAKARELRAFIEKYSLSGYAQEDWQAGEDALKAGEAAYGTDNRAATDALETAVARYNAVIEIGAAALLSKLEGSALEAKDAAQKAGAAAAFASQFRSAEARLEQAGAARADGRFEEAGFLYDEAGIMFNALVVKTELAEQKQLLDRYSLGQYVAQEADQAERQFLEGETLFETDPRGALQAYASARETGRAALEQAAQMVTGTAQSGAEIARSLADEVKAGVAVKQVYGKAAELYAAGVQARNSKRYVEAYALLDEATGLFKEAYITAREKRDQAQTALEREKAELREIEQRARAAEAELFAAGAVQTKPAE
jgi:hypothetical protein